VLIVTALKYKDEAQHAAQKNNEKSAGKIVECRLLGKK
jgi:hypothetical protein